jgi:hypothetical protein
MVNQILILEYIHMEPLDFYTQRKMHMKSSRLSVEHRSGAPSFLYVVLRVLKIVEVVWNIDWEPLIFLYTAMRVLKIVEVEAYIDW